MKLYVCWTARDTPGPHRHACTRAHDALRDAGHDPQVVRTYSFGALPGFLQTPGRQSWVPILVTDDGDVIGDSRAIEAWASEHPAQV